MSKKSDKMIQDQLNMLNSYIGSIQPDKNIMGEGQYSADLLNKIRSGEDISTLMPGETNLIKQMSMNNAEVTRTLKGAGNRAFGGVDPNLDAQLGTEYSMASEKGAADTYQNLLQGEEGQAENTIFGAGEYGTGVQFQKANAMGSALGMTIQNQQRIDQNSRSKFASILGAIGTGVGIFTGAGGLSGIANLFKT